MPLLKFDKKIDIALRSKVLTQHRAKECQAADMVLLAGGFYIEDGYAYRSQRHNWIIAHRDS